MTSKALITVTVFRGCFQRRRLQEHRQLLEQQLQRSVGGLEAALERDIEGTCEDPLLLLLLLHFLLLLLLYLFLLLITDSCFQSQRQKGDSGQASAQRLWKGRGAYALFLWQPEDPTGGAHYWLRLFRDVPMRPPLTPE